MVFNSLLLCIDCVPIVAGFLFRWPALKWVTIWRILTSFHAPGKRGGYVGRSLLLPDQFIEFCIAGGSVSNNGIQHHQRRRWHAAAQPATPPNASGNQSFRAPDVCGHTCQHHVAVILAYHPSRFAGLMLALPD